MTSRLSVKAGNRVSDLALNQGLLACELGDEVKGLKALLKGLE